MADTAAIVNLMRHAANRLNEEDCAGLTPPGAPVEYRERAIAAGTAMAYAEAILRTVAAALEETPGGDPR